jgi:hypothetical protein
MKTSLDYIFKSNDFEVIIQETGYDPKYKQMEEKNGMLF